MEFESKYEFFQIPTAFFQIRNMTGMQLKPETTTTNFLHNSFTIGLSYKLLKIVSHLKSVAVPPCGSVV